MRTGLATIGLSLYLCSDVCNIMGRDDEIHTIHLVFSPCCFHCYDQILCTVLESVRVQPGTGTNTIPRDNPMSSSNSKDLNLHCAVQLVLCRWETWPKPFNCFQRRQLREETREMMEKQQFPSIDVYVLNGVAR